MKFGQLVEYNIRNIFLPNLSRKYLAKLVQDHFLFLRKALYKVKANILQLSFNIFLHAIKTNYIKLLDCWSSDMLNFDISGKGSGVVSYHILCMILLEKCFPFYIPWIDRILIGQYVYFNCFFTRWWNHKFWN